VVRGKSGRGRLSESLRQWNAGNARFCFDISDRSLVTGEMPLRTFVILLASSLVAHAGWLKPDVDFSNYDVPLHEQIVNRVKAKISNRLGEGTNTRDRYFIIPFAYENDGNDPEFSHSFISVIRVFADDKQPKLTQGLKLRRYKNREFEAFTISWLPRDFMTNPHLCVFKGTGARPFAKANDCPLSPGRNFTLEETIKLGANEKNAHVGTLRDRQEGV
jgi:hypothetical protein